MKIAVVGMGCHYPGAKSAKELFENLLSGRRYFRDVPDERWSTDGYYNPDKKHSDTTYCKRAALIEGFEFNGADFRIPRSVYNATDPAQWLALQVAKQALDDANLSNIQRQATAVIIGNTLTGEVSRSSVLRFRWPYVQRVFNELLDNMDVKGVTKEKILKKVETRYKAPFPPINEDNLAGSLSNTIAGRISNYFGLNGGAYTTDGACSSSLLAINQACIGLERGDFNLALCGGVDISLDPFEIVGFSKVGALTDKDIQVYDKNSSGFLPGEGCGIVVLKRLEDAQADNNRIYSVVNGVGMSSDGKGGITAPSISGQTLAVGRAYKSTNYSFADVELIEGHGTGTSVGDSVELNTFNNAKENQQSQLSHRCGLGSIKSNIGHTKAAAGVAGFIKSALSVYYGLLPPTMGINTPNTVLSESNHIYPLLTGKPWPGTHQRRAAVSSAGFGGINIHITLSSVGDKKSAPKKEVNALKPLLHSQQDTELLLLGANSISQLRDSVDTLLDTAPRMSLAELSDLAFYCAQNLAKDKKQSSMYPPKLRVGVVARTPQELTDRLNKISQYLKKHTKESDLQYTDIEEGVYISNRISVPRIAFLFPGQGTQSLNMSNWMRKRDDKFSNFLKECDSLLKENLGGSITDLIYQDVDLFDQQSLKNAKDKLNDTRIAQPAIIANSMASANYLKELGILPTIAVGHSLGEYAALWSAGVLETNSALSLVAARGEAMTKSSSVPGAMLSIAAGPEKVAELVAEVVGYVSIANLNSPQQTVVSGEASTVDNLIEVCTHFNINATKLPVSSAFHSKLMINARDSMNEHLSKQKFGELRHSVVSSASGKLLSNKTDYYKLLSDQILNPVLFVDAINTLVKEKYEVFVEVGPGSTLTSLTKSIIGNEQNTVFSADIGARGEKNSDLNNLLAYLYTSGLSLNIDKIYEGRFFRPIDIPYKPKFIENPCESEVESLDLDMDFSVFGLPDTGAVENTVEITDASGGANVSSANVSSSMVSNSSKNSKDENILDITAMEKKIKTFVVKQYGYSSDMVTSDSRLQEQLGLDSLKSAEVAFEIMAEIGVRGDITSLGDSSINELATYLLELLEHKTSGSSQGSNLSSVLDESLLPPWVRPFEHEVIAQAQDTTKFNLPQGNVLLTALEHSELLETLSLELTSLGHTTQTYIGDNEPVIQEPIAACIFLASSGESPDLLKVNDESITERLYSQPEMLFRAANLFLQHNSKVENQFFAFVSAGGGKLIKNSHQSLHSDLLTGGGFVKTLHLENKTVKTRVIDLEPSLSSQTKSDLIISEMLHGEGHEDVGYPAKNERITTQLKNIPTLMLEEQKNGLQNTDVVLVTGGGKGITAECMLALGQKLGLRFALLGSSALPEPGSNNTQESELAQNLDRFRALGIEYSYYQCDVLDTGKVEKLISTIESEMGPIKAIVHAAGVNTPHRIEKTTWPEFLRVLRPKMEGLLNILSSVNIDQLKSVIAFSSIIGHSGMQGNGDYAYANDWVDRVLKLLKQHNPDLNCQSYGFSVWASVGMGARTQSVDILGAMGIDAIPMNEGVETFTNLVTKQWQDTSMIVSSRLGALDTVRLESPKIFGSRFIENILHHEPGIELVSEVFLTPQTDPYLADHDYEGSLLLPAVLGIEAMVQCARACVGTKEPLFTKAPTLKNLVFEKAIIVPEQGRHIRIYARAHERRSDGTQQVSLAIRSNVTHYEVDYFSAECEWQTNILSNGKANTVNESYHNKKSNGADVSLNVDNELKLEPLKDLYGKILFQGPQFQNIQAYHELSDKHCVVRIGVPTNQALFESNNFKDIQFGYPQVRDTFLHAVQLCVPQYKILPVAMEEVTFVGHNGPHVYLHAVERERTENEFLYDLEVYDAQLHCVEKITGFRCRIMSNYEDQDNLSVIYAAHEQSKELRSESEASS